MSHRHTWYAQTVQTSQMLRVAPRREITSKTHTFDTVFLYFNWFSKEDENDDTGGGEEWRNRKS